MAEEIVNTVDQQITDPSNPEVKIDNPDYVVPVVAPVAAENKLDLNTTQSDVQAVSVRKTGNATIDAVGALLADKKVADADQIIADFADTGEVSLTTQASLVESLGEHLATLAINQLTGEAKKLQDANTTARSEVLDYANKVFNGESADKTWTEIQDFVKSPESGFTAEDRDAMTSMLSAGGLSAQLVIDRVAAVYAKDSNTTIPADLLAGDTLATGATFTPISALDYASELSKLMQTQAYDSPAVQQLQARRVRSQNMGA